MLSKIKVYVFSTIVVIGSYLWLLINVNGIGELNFTVCPTKLIYGIPCPGCGITRAAVCFVRGEIIEVLFVNPNVIIAVVFLSMAPFVLIYDALTRQAVMFRIYTYFELFVRRKIFICLFCLAEFTIWVHNIVLKL